MESCPIDPVSYSQNCTFQQTRAINFLLRCASLSGWDRLKGLQVVDVGCGPGTSPKWILELFPEIGRILALDAYQEVVALGNVLYPNDKIEYIMADISNRDSLECWERTIPKVISTWCLQYLKNQREAFANIHFLLQHNGEAAILFMLHSTYYDALSDVAQSPKWKDSLPEAPENYIPESHIKKLDASHYHEILEEVGFFVTLCEMEKTEYLFFSDEECRGFLASLCTLMKKLPSEMKDDFLNDFFQSFLKRNGRSRNGRILYHYTLLNVLVRKSFDPIIEF